MTLTQHGIGREVEDDELFDDSANLSHVSGKRAQSSHARTERSCDGHSKRHCSNSEIRDGDFSDETFHPRLKSRDKSKMARWEIERLKFKNTLPRTVDEAIAELSLPGENELPKKLNGAVRLSTMARATAGSLFYTTELRDLSKLTDYHGFMLLTSKPLTPAALTILEEANPCRIRLLDGLWAITVKRLLNIEVRPDWSDSWRAVYQNHVTLNEKRLCVTRERVRAGYAAQSVAKVTSIGKHRPLSRSEGNRRVVQNTSSLSRIERLRLQARKDRRKHMR